MDAASCPSHPDIYVCRQHGSKECEHSSQEKFGPYTRCEHCNKLQVWHVTVCELCGNKKICSNCLKLIAYHGDTRFKLG